MKRGSPALGFLRVLASALALVQTAPLALFASPPQQVTQNVTATVTFGPRITLQVSSQVLHFHVTDPSAPALASVDFAVAGRTGKAGELVLAVEVVEPPVSMPVLSGDCRWIRRRSRRPAGGRPSQRRGAVARRRLSKRTCDFPARCGARPLRDPPQVSGQALWRFLARVTKPPRLDPRRRGRASRHGRRAASS